MQRQNRPAYSSFVKVRCRIPWVLLESRFGKSRLQNLPVLVQCRRRALLNLGLKGRGPLVGVRPASCSCIIYRLFVVS